MSDQPRREDETTDLPPTVRKEHESQRSGTGATVEESAAVERNTIDFSLGVDTVTGQPLADGSGGATLDFVADDPAATLDAPHGGASPDAATGAGAEKAKPGR